MIFQIVEYKKESTIRKLILESPVVFHSFARSKFFAITVNYKIVAKKKSIIQNIDHNYVYILELKTHKTFHNLSKLKKYCSERPDMPHNFAN